MGTAQVNLFGTGISWDRYSISLDSGDSKRSIYYCSGSSEVSEDTLYASETISTGLWGFLRGQPELSYRVTRDDSPVLEAIYQGRELFQRLFHAIIPLELFDGRFAKRSDLSQIGYLFSVVVLDSAIVALGPKVIVLVGIGMLVTNGDRLWRYFPVGWRAIPHLVFGMACCLPTALTVTIVGIVVMKAMELMGLPCQGYRPSVDHVLGSPQLKLIVAAYVIVGAAWLEEVIFRGRLRDYFVSRESNGDHQGFTWERLMSLVKTSAVFGLCHVSPSKGWMNIPLVLAASSFGMGFSLIGELTGDLWGPLGAHMGFNAMAILEYLLVGG